MKKNNLLILLLIFTSAMTLAANTSIIDATNPTDTVANSHPEKPLPKDTGCVQSPLIGVPIDVAVPPPSDLTARLVDNQVILRWMSVADTHRVHYGTASFAEVTEDNYAPWGLSHYQSKCVPKGTQTTIDNLNKGAHYYFVVTAIHNNIQSPPSNEVSILSPVFNI